MGSLVCEWVSWVEGQVAGWAAAKFSKLLCYTLPCFKVVSGLYLHAGLTHSPCT